MKRKITESDLLYYFNGELSPAEEQEILEWKESSEENRQLFVKTQKEHLKLILAIHAPEIKREWLALRKRLNHKKQSWRRYVATAAIAGVVLASGALTYRYFSVGDEAIALIGLPENAAILELSDGTQHRIGATHNEFTEQDGTRLEIGDGEVIYDSDDASAEAEVIYNKITVPRGASHFRITLPDGSVIWLNSESRLEYPLAFSATERRVRMRGEAYFDVAKDAAKPFVVETAHQAVTVLGTGFNVSAYPSEPVFTTLVSGRVRVDVADRDDHLELAPGQQSRLDVGNLRLTVQDVVASRYASWKDGIISIENMSMSEVLTILSRRYDVRFGLENPKLSEIVLIGNIPSDESLNVVLHALEAVADIKFKINANGEIKVTMHK